MVGDIVGRELGFTATNPLAPGRGSGTGDSPFQFQGVSTYDLFDGRGNAVAQLSATFLEGRTFGVRFSGAEKQPALRFGYFGPIFNGSGPLKDISGILTGTAGVAIAPHIFSNVYLGRLNDPDGRFRVS
jgi:hypothetical protein